MRNCNVWVLVLYCFLDCWVFFRVSKMSSSSCWQMKISRNWEKNKTDTSKVQMGTENKDTDHTQKKNKKKLKTLTNTLRVVNVGHWREVWWSGTLETRETEWGWANGMGSIIPFGPFQWIWNCGRPFFPTFLFLFLGILGEQKLIFFFFFDKEKEKKNWPWCVVYWLNLFWPVSWLSLFVCLLCMRREIGFGSFGHLGVFWGQWCD